MPKFLTLDDIDPAGKTVLLRADLNVPMKDGAVSDATRIERLAPTIRELAGKGARVVVMSHFGRPKGRDPALSLRAARAGAGAGARRPRRRLRRGLHRARGAARRRQALHARRRRRCSRICASTPRKRPTIPPSRAALAALGDIYVNDAFSAAHRAHASTEAIAHLLPAVGGRLMQAELEALAAALETPEHPVMAIVGGAKVSTKLDLLDFILAKVDVLVIGGAMANTLLSRRASRSAPRSSSATWPTRRATFSREPRARRGAGAAGRCGGGGSARAGRGDARSCRSTACRAIA